MRYIQSTLNSGCLLVLTLSLLQGCNNTPHAHGYRPETSQNYQPTNSCEIVHIDVGTEPQVRRSRYPNHILIGYSSYEGRPENEIPAYCSLKAFARKKGANVVLLSEEYLRTGVMSGVLPLPQQDTTYHSGSISGSSGHASYSGTSTTHTTQYQPYSSTYDIYSIRAWYLRDPTVNNSK